MDITSLCFENMLSLVWELGGWLRGEQGKDSDLHIVVLGIGSWDPSGGSRGVAWHCGMGHKKLGFWEKGS